MSSQPKLVICRVNKPHAKPRKPAAQTVVPRIHARESRTSNFYMFTYKMENGRRRRLSLRNGVYNYGTVHCPDAFGSRRQCPRGKKCMYAHNMTEVLYHPLVYKTRFCKKEESCSEGNACAWAHSRDELRILKSILGRGWRSAEPVGERMSATRASGPKRQRVRLVTPSSSSSVRSADSVNGCAPMCQSTPSRTATPQSESIDVMSVSVSASPVVEEVAGECDEEHDLKIPDGKMGEFERWFRGVYDCDEPTGLYAGYLSRFMALNLDDMNFLWRFYSSERVKFLDVLRKEIGWRGEHSLELFGKLLCQYHMPMDVCEWMERVVILPQYRNLFERFGTCDLLANVGFDKDDLVEMGVSSPGHQIKILFHLRELAKEFGC